MHPRETIEEKFSTFFDQGMWKRDQELLTNFQRLIQEYGDQNENFCLDHFWRSYQNNTDPLAEKHILAFLDEPCGKIANSLKKETLAALNLSKEDCFQIARDVARNNWCSIFQKYNSQRGKRKDWIVFKLPKIFMDQIRKGGEFQNRSDWSILKSSSKKSLRESLKYNGIEEKNHWVYLLALAGFKTIYTGTQTTSQRQLPEPSKKEWVAITEYFNSRNTEQKTVQEVQGLLRICIDVLRAKNHLEFNNLDQEKATQKVGTLELEISEKYEDWCSDAEQKIENEEIINVLDQAIASLPEDAKRMLHLKYGLQLTDQDIAPYFGGVNQSTINRRLRSYKIDITKRLLEYYENHHEIARDEVLINQISTSSDLINYLNDYFHNQVSPSYVIQ